MRIAIIKYNAGNIMSVDYALQRLGIEAEVTNDEETIRKADKVIFPGVGEASTTMAFLKNHKHSTENNVDCMGIFDEEIVRFEPEPGKANIIKVPHMGWNDLTNLRSPLFDGSIEGQFVYFVHSYYATLGEHTAATSNYIVSFSAAMHKDNFYATQFHPEKSGPVGSRILKNFIEKC
jgi:glutamine amidotransferase